jgi:hypothetical protein
MTANPVIAPRRLLAASLSLLLMGSFPARAEVVGVTIASQTAFGGGREFGAVGPYEQLVGRIDFALDPDDPHNGNIVDLAYAPRAADGRVHFSSDLQVLRPRDPSKGNGVLLFDIANRGARLTLLYQLHHLSGPDPERIGDALLMRDGYTLVAVGWEFDVPATALRATPPPATFPTGVHVDPLSVDVIVNTRMTETFLIDEPVRPPAVYPPADFASATDVLTVRDRFWDDGVVIPRERWRFATGSEPPKVQLDGGFDPGRWYRVTYRPTRPVVAGVGLAAIRDAAAAFRYRSDLPVRGRSAYAFGLSQTGRFLRTFLYDGFNVDEHGRRVFDAVWVHKAGAARGSFNERFATPSHGDMFASTRFPFSETEQRDVDGKRDSLQSRYRAGQHAKVFYTETSVEYWGGGRAAALTHTSVDGEQDLRLPDDVRVYLFAGTQHIPFPFPPERRPTTGGATGRNDGQELGNPIPHRDIMRGLLRAWHQWAADGTEPPPSRHPRLRDETLVSIEDVDFPALPGVADPRRIEGPARIVDGKVARLPHLVPQVDRDGNEIAGIRDPEVAVPLATTTGWNFRSEKVGNSTDIYQTLGSYIPFPATRAAREARGDPRLSIEERYSGRGDYLQRVESAATDLVRRRYLLEEDLDDVLARAGAHWDFATRESLVP